MLLTTRTTLPTPVSQNTPRPSHTSPRKAGHFPFLSPSLNFPQLLKSFPWAVWKSWAIISRISHYILNLFSERCLHLLAPGAVSNVPKDTTSGAAPLSHGHSPHTHTHSTTEPESKAGVLLLPCSHFQAILPHVPLPLNAPV